MFASRIRTSENSSTTAVRGPQCRRRPPRRRREASPDPVRTYHRSRRRGAHRTRRARRRDLRRRPLLHPRRRSTPFFGMDRRKGSTSRPRTRARGPGRPPGRVRGRLPWATAEPILLGGPSTAGTAVLRYCIRSKSDTQAHPITPSYSFRFAFVFETPVVEGDSPIGTRVETAQPPHSERGGCFDSARNQHGCRTSLRWASRVCRICTAGTKSARAGHVHSRRC